MTRQELLVAAKPILFNTEMVRAILDNRKIVTRRVVKKTHVDDVLNSQVRIENLDVSDDKFINCLCSAPYEKGDILYVRETWQIDSIDDKTNEMLINFKALQENYSGMQIDCNFSSERYKDVRKFYQKKGWQSSIHMPKEAARIFLRVTDVRVERLQDITEQQAKAEGVITNDAVKVSSYIYWFKELWDSTLPLNRNKFKCKENAWASNPWVWVIEFERVEETNNETI